MTKEQFMYEHDLESIVYLINKHVEMNTTKQSIGEVKKEKEKISARELFI